MNKSNIIESYFKTKYLNIRPLILIAIGLLCGYLSERFLSGTQILMFIILAGGLTIYSFYRKDYILLLFVFSFLLGLIRVNVAYPKLNAENKCKVEGIICDTVSYSNNLYTIIIDNVKVNSEKVSGKAILYSGIKPKHCDFGDYVLFNSVREDINEDRYYYYLSKNITFISYNNTLILSRKGNCRGLNGILGDMRQWVSSSLDDCYGDNGGIAKALVLGDRSDITYEQMEYFNSSGTSHILALSGLHISIILAFLSVLLGKLEYNYRTTIIMIVVFIFGMITKFPSSLVRAVIIWICLTLSVPLRRKYDGLSAIALAFIILTLINPFNIYSIGFQLSFLAILGIILLRSNISSKTNKVFHKYISDSISSSLCGTIGTLPVMINSFGVINTYTLISNIVIIPLVTITMFPAILSVIAYSFAPELGRIIGMAGSLIFNIMTYYAEAFANLPYSQIEVGSPGIIAVIAYYCLMVVISRYWLKRGSARWITASACILIIIFSSIHMFK